MKWVAAELAETAQAAGEDQWDLLVLAVRGHRIGLVEVKAGEPFPSIPIQGHIDDPRSEGERIAELELFGRVRLARVDVERDGGRFLGWISASEESFARVKGERRPAGSTAWTRRRSRTSRPIRRARARDPPGDAVKTSQLGLRRRSRSGVYFSRTRRRARDFPVMAMQPRAMPARVFAVALRAWWSRMPTARLTCRRSG